MRLSLVCLLVPVALCAFGAGHDARAIELADARDNFSFAVDVHGMPACVTYPLSHFDRVECDGLDPAREAELRAHAPEGTQWVGNAVFRGDSWGFRLAVMREDLPPGTMNDDQEKALLTDLRKALPGLNEPGSLVGGEAGLTRELVTVNGLKTAHFVYAAKMADVGVLRWNVTVVPAESGIYMISFYADEAHGSELAKIAARAMPSLRVRPRPSAQWTPAVIALYVVFPFAVFFGVLFLVARLLSSRRGSAASVSWPGVRGDGV